jgi:hypothetical protein
MPMEGAARAVAASSFYGPLTPRAAVAIQKGILGSCADNKTSLFTLAIAS